MTTSQEAIALLKEKLAALSKASVESKIAFSDKNDDILFLNPPQGTVPLAAKYVHASINPDWDPEDHPRDPNTGEFIKTLGGFIFGKAKKAKFATAGKSGLKQIELDLKPGDVAFKTPGKNIVVSHADGSYTLHHGATGKTSTVPEGSHAVLAEKAMNGDFEKVGENPGTKVPAKSMTDAAAMVKDPKKFGGETTDKIYGSEFSLIEGKIHKEGCQHVKAAETAGKKVEKNASLPLTDLEKHLGKADADNPAKASVDKSKVAPCMDDEAWNALFQIGKAKKKQKTEDAKGTTLDLGVHEVPDDFDMKSFPYQSIKMSGFGSGDVIAMVVGGSQNAHGEWTKKPTIQVGVLHQQNGDWKFLVPGVQTWGMGKGNATFPMAKVGETDDYPTDDSQPKQVKVANTDGNIMAMLMGAKAPKQSIPVSEPKTKAPIVSSIDLLKKKNVIPPPPPKKPGKAGFTAKQYADYQKDAAGSLLFSDKDGNSVTSGSWIDVDGKPYQIHASPYGIGKITVYRWVSTKQQASNLEKEDFFTGEDLNKAKAIPDPTGGPYPPTGEVQTTTDAPVKPKHGSIMSQSVTGAIPSTATAYKKHVQEMKGKSFWVADPGTNGGWAEDKSGNKIVSGDWVEIEGKPVQVHASPNEGLIGVSKWVGTKKQASNNIYDFPGWAILTSAVKIEDPTGKDYTPVADASSSEPQEAEAQEVEVIEEDPDAALLTVTDVIQIDHGQYVKKANGSWYNYPGDGPAIAEDSQDHDYLEDFLDQKKDFEAKVASMSVGDTVVATSKKSGKKTAYTKYDADTIIQFPPAPGSAETTAPFTNFQNVVSKASAHDLFDLEFYKAKDLTPADQTNEEVLAPKPEIVPSDGTGNPVFKHPVTNYVQSLPAGTGVWKHKAFPEYFAIEDGTTGQITIYDANGVSVPDVKFNSENWNPYYVSIGPAPQTETSEPATTENAFVHPVSGVYFPLGPNAKVYKHKTSENAYIVVNEGDENPINFFTTTGMQQKPKAFQKNLDKAYEVVDVWPGKKDGVFQTAEGKKVATAPGMPAVKEVLESAVTGDQIQWEDPTGTVHLATKSDEVDGLGAPLWVHESDGIKLMNSFILAMVENPAWTTNHTFFPKSEQKSVQEDMTTVTPAKPDSPSSAPVGTKISITSADGEESVFEKVGDNKWASTVNGSIYPDSTFTDFDSPSSAPVGTKISITSADEESVFEKVGDNKWASDGEVVAAGDGPKPLDENDISTASPGDKITYQTENAFVGLVEHTLIKQPDGKWYHGMSGQSVTSIKVHNLLLEDDGTSNALFFKSGEDDSNAPNSDWGSPEATGAPTPPAPEKKKSTAKAKKVALPKTVTLPNGQDLDLKPGEAYGKIAINNYNGVTTYYVHMRPGSIPNTVYGSDGGTVYWWPGDKIKTLTGLKKSIKDNGGELLGEYPIPTAEKVDFSGYQSIKTFADQNQTIYALSNWLTDYINDNGAKTLFSKVIPTTYYGSIDKYKSVFTVTEDDGTEKAVNWGGLDDFQKAEQIAKTGEVAGRIHATLAQTDSWGLSKSEKAKVTKARNAAVLTHRVAVLAKEISDPDTDWSEEKFTEELSFLATKASSENAALGMLKTVVPLGEFHSTLVSANIKRKFRKSLTDIDFDPYSATTAEYDKYAKSKGFNYLAALTPEDQKNWVLSDLGDPSLQHAAKAQAEKAAKDAQSKILVAELAAALKKQNGKAVVSTVPKIEGAWAKASLKKSYHWKTEDNGVSITHTGPDEWMVQAGVDTIPANDALVMGLVNGAVEQGYLVNADPELAYGQPQLAAYSDFEAKHGIDLNSASQYDPLLAPKAVELGNPVANAMASAHVFMWLRAYAEKDHVAMYHMEKQYFPGGVHPKADSHIGSPDSLLGKAAYAAIASKLAESEVGYKWLTGIETSLTSSKKIELVTPFVGYEPNHPNANNWIINHPQEILAQFAPSVAQTGDKPVAFKPPYLNDDAWDLVSDVEAGTDLTSLIPNNSGVSQMTMAEMESTLANSAVAANKGLIAPLVAALPMHLKRLSVWAIQDQNDPTRQGIIEAIAVKAKAGEYLEETTPVWISPTGTKFPISPGARVLRHKTNPDNFFVSGPPSPDGGVNWTGYVVTSGGQTKYTVSSYQFDEWDLVFTMPNPVQWDQAKKDNPDFDETLWAETSKIETGTSTAYQNYNVGAVLTAELKKNKVLQQEYPNLYAQHKVLPDQVRQSVLAALEKGHDAILKMLEYKASKGHFSSMQSEGLFAANKPWLPHLSLGQTSDSAILNDWTVQAKDAYMVHFGLNDHGQIPAHLSSLLNPAVAALESGPTWNNQPDWDNIVLTPTGKSLGGMHSKHHLVDSDGNEWMQKTFASDPTMAPYRIEAETGALEIGNLFGFRGPLAMSISLTGGGSGGGKKATSGGKYSYLQYLKPSPHDLASKNPNDLTLKQLQQAMEEHLLDWLVSNHDTHPQNLRVDESGNVFGIDKGQAFKFFPQDKLAVGYLPPGNPEAVWFDRFYNGVQNGSIPKTTADEVVKHVLRRAQRLSKDKDTEFRALLEKALSKRPNFPDEFPTKEKFIDGLVERKHNSFDDFVEFYKSVYAKSPYAWDIDTDNLVPPMLDEHTHVAVSPDFAKEVERSGAHGKAIFFASDHLEDSHVLMSTAVAKDGKIVLTGEAKIREDGDKILTQWLQQQTVQNAPVVHQQSVPTVMDDPYKVLPGNDALFSAMVAYSKTVSSHNASGDHQYNQTTVQHANKTLAGINSMYVTVEKWEQDNPGLPFTSSVAATHTDLFGDKVTLYTMEQHEQFKKMLEQYRDYHAKVKGVENTDNKVSPHFTQFLYTPSDKAKQEYEKKTNPSDIPVGSTYAMPSGGVWTKQESGDWKNEAGTILSEDALTAEGAPEISQVQVPEDDSVTSEVQVGTKVLKVTYRPSAFANGAYNMDNGKLELTGGETSHGVGNAVVQSGNMYEIDFGTTKVFYRPWKGAGVNLTQQGLMRIERHDWESDDYQSINEVFDILRQIGLDLDPASEESMELFYWKHMAGILNERADGNDAKWGKVNKHLSTNLTPGMGTAEELSVYRDAWAQAIGVEKVESAYDTGRYLPKFARQSVFALENHDDNFTTGHAFWERPDIGVADLKAQGVKMPATSLTYGGQWSDAVRIALSGAMFSAEERARLYGSGAKGGASSQDDAGKGSSAQVFTKPGVGNNSSYQVFYHPRVLLRTSNYRFSTDNFGAINAKQNSAHWDPDKAFGSGYELCVKYAVSVLDDIGILTFQNDIDRKKAIDAYKAQGITMVHGLPIEEVFIIGNPSSTQYKKVFDKLWADAIKEEQMKEQVNAAA